jgi:hypothetical protein
MITDYMTLQAVAARMQRLRAEADEARKGALARRPGFSLPSARADAPPRQVTGPAPPAKP